VKRFVCVVYWARPLTLHQARHFAALKMHHYSRRFLGQAARLVASARPRAALKTGAALLASGLLVAPAFAEPSKATDTPRRTFEPCPEVSCKSKEELLAMFSGGSGGNEGFRRRKPTSGSSSTSPSGGSSALSSTAGGEHSAPALGCPPDREFLGQSTWTFLHALAAYYPEHPTDEEKNAVRGLVQALKLLYPCSHCRAQLVVDLEKLPVEPALASRKELSLWVCKQHNFVNESLGKKTFPCDIESLDERWRKGRPECWGGVSAGAGADLAEESMGRMSVEEEKKEEEEDSERMQKAAMASAAASSPQGPSRRLR
jgi:mitochondrial FAD-linked sulfhydryl oxidase